MLQSQQEVQGEIYHGACYSNTVSTGPKMANASTQTPIPIPITIQNIAKGKFHETPSTAERPQDLSSDDDSTCLPLEDVTKARASIPCPKTGSVTENLYESRKDWPIPHAPASTPVSMVKTEMPPQDVAISHAIGTPNPNIRTCVWGPNWHIWKNNKKHEED